ncbi:hypothetical protein FR943_13250 [Mycobacterium sp. TNTM28]|uniref:Uncharacterized protein n=1 Tax=[Mycobacterium] fortunisiensis TaxID=2600579 RepID=A0ABS6KMK3_9MYCO|nr:hypothetical protein [[Mycobacterium] fortunisiensis]MBU9764803.1 hypothetical protein [[Mycobacterium] fortunisiensis]
MNSIVRATVGGVCLGAGVAIGAHSGGWFLLLAVALAAMGMAVVAGALTRPVTAGAAGELVPVTVDMIDRSAANPAIASTVVAGEARPAGDAPFRFHHQAQLSRAQIAGLVTDGRGELPSEALGAPPGGLAVTEHRGGRGHAPAALAALAAMWATMLLPPSGIWDLKPLTRSVSAAAPSAISADPGSRPLWQWYDEALAHLRTEAPDALTALLDFDIRDTDVDVEVYLGADRVRVHEGDADGWTTSEATTASRSRDTFTVDDLQGFSVRDFLAGAAAMLPPEHREAAVVEIARNNDDIFGAERPVLAQGRFGQPSITVQGKTDGTIASWWPPDDVAAGLRQVEAALAAAGIPADAADIKDIDLSTGSDGDFSVDFYRGERYSRIRAQAGRFPSAEDPIGEGQFTRFRLSDVSPAVVVAARDDAMRRYEVDPVDRGKAALTIGEWGSDGGARADEVVIEVDFHDAHGGTAVYTLSGELLTG